MANDEAPDDSVEVLLKRWKVGLALVADDSLALLAFENDGPERTCAETGAAHATNSATADRTVVLPFPLIAVPLCLTVFG